MSEKLNNRKTKKTTARVSLVVWCAGDGTVELVEHDAYRLVTRGCGSNLLEIFDSSCQEKARLIIEEMQNKSALFDWEFTVTLGGKLQPLKLSAVAVEGRLLILADPEIITLQHVLMEVSSKRCIDGSVLSSVIENYGCGTFVEPKNSRLYNEIIRLSNQQAALHRELAKKTVTLELRTTELKGLNRLLSAITDGIQDSILLLDASSKILWANKAAQLNMENNPGRVSCSSSELHEPVSSFSCPAKKVMDSGKPESCEHCYIDENGNKVYTEETVFPIMDDNGLISQLVSITKDITRRKQAEELLLQETLTDELTGIHNRRAFDRLFINEWKRALRERSYLTVVMIDIDYFKNYNDCYGHQQGDTCLQAVAHCIRKAARRPADLVARYGGEEFVMVLPNTDAQNAVTITDTIRTNLRSAGILHKDSSVSSFVTVSIGVATMVPTTESSPERLLQSSDKALYTAKRLGRNRVHSRVVRRIS